MSDERYKKEIDGYLTEIDELDDEIMERLVEEMTENSKELDLKTLRGQIDRADQMLLTSFVTRMRICKQVAEFKKKNGLQVYDAEREKEKLEEIRKISPDDMEESCVMLYNKIMELSRELQEKIISE